MPSLMRFLTAIATMAAIGYGALFALATFVTPRPRAMTEAIPAQRLRPAPVEAASKNPKTAGAEAPAGTSATP